MTDETDWVFMADNFCESMRKLENYWLHKSILRSLPKSYANNTLHVMARGWAVACAIFVGISFAPSQNDASQIKLIK